MLVSNQYGYGEDNLGLPKTQRIHTDDSIEVRYYNNPNNDLDLVRRSQPTERHPVEILRNFTFKRRQRA
jgi:hypothetical protein